MAAKSTTVTARQTKDGLWRWDWKSPNGTPSFGVGFPTRRAAMAAGKKKEKEHDRLFVVSQEDDE